MTQISYKHGGFESVPLNPLIHAVFIFRLLPWTETILPPSDLHVDNSGVKLLFISSLYFTFSLTNISHGYDIQREHGTSTVYSILRRKSMSCTYLRNHYALMSHIVKSIYCTHSISLSICSHTFI